MSFVSQKFHNLFRRGETALHELSYIFWECTLRCNLNCAHCGSDCRADAITPDIEAMTGGAGTKLGTGGMATKISAAKIATEAGVTMIIANGQDPAVLYDIMDGRPVGTRFTAKEAAQ